MNLRGSLPTLYSLGVGLQVGLGLDLFGYMLSIYKEYDIYHIWKDLPSSIRCLLIPLRCTPIRAEHHRSWSYGLNLPWWCGPCLLPWVLGVIPPTDTSLRVSLPFFTGWSLPWEWKDPSKGKSMVWHGGGFRTVALRGELAPSTPPVAYVAVVFSPSTTSVDASCRTQFCIAKSSTHICAPRMSKHTYTIKL